MARNWNLLNDEKFLVSRAISGEIFHILLTLFLPLSILILAHFYSYNYLLVITSDPSRNQSSPNFLLINPFIPLALVSVFAVFALIRSFTCKIPLLPQPTPQFYSQPHLCAAWVLLTLLGAFQIQVCVRMKTEGRGIDGLRYETTPDHAISWWSIFVFCLGLHETMLHWSGAVVKPVVDDTVYGGVMEERWVGKAAMTVSFGGLWWWRLKNAVEVLVVLAGAKREAMLGFDLTDLVGCSLYYITVIIGIVRIVKGVLWFGSIFLCCCRRRRRDTVDSYRDDDNV